MITDPSENNALTHLESLGNIEPVLKYAGMNATERAAYAEQLASDSGNCTAESMTSALEGMLGSMPMREVTVQATISIKLVVPLIMDVNEMVDQFAADADYAITSQTAGVIVVDTEWEETIGCVYNEEIAGGYDEFVNEPARVD